MKHHMFPQAVLLCIAVLVAGRTDAQWVRQQVFSDATFLYSIGFGTDSIGCAVGSKAGVWSGRIVRTTDRGATWVPALVPDSARSIIGLQWLSPTLAYAAGAYNVSGVSDSVPFSIRKYRGIAAPLAYGYREHLCLLGIDSGATYRGYFLRSTDAGNTWEPYGTLPESVLYVYDISFPTSTTGYAAADTGATYGAATILKTTDGGTSWQKTAIPDSVVTLNSIRFVDSLRGCAVGYTYKGQVIHGIIVHTTDGGSNWMGTEFPSVGNFTKVSFSSGSEGYASGISTLPPQGVIFNTTDGGATWRQLSPPGDTLIECNISFLWNTDLGIAFGDAGYAAKPFIARTPDGGSLWSMSILNGMPSFTMLIGAAFIDSLNAFVCGGSFSDSAVIFRTTNGGVTGIKDGGRDLPHTFGLDQNYPNPFNPVTTISFSIPSRSFVTLKVYDVLGREVSVLVNGEMEAGYHTAQWIGSDKSSGVYYYRLQSGSYSETKKLLLLK